MRVAVIDSGVNPAHPHIVGPVRGGVSIGGPDETYLDYLGHGTAVMAAIEEKAPEAELYAVRIFHRELRTRIEWVTRGIEWCLEQRMDYVNLSLGTMNAGHREAFEWLVERAIRQGMTIVSARRMNGVEALPGSLEGVVGVEEDASLGRDEYRREGAICWGSPYPRPIPGIPPERNLQGISFAVANVTGLLVREGLVRGPRSGPL